MASTALCSRIICVSGWGGRRSTKKRLAGDWKEAILGLWLLSAFLCRWRIRYSREAGPVNLWGRKTAKGLDFLFPTPAPAPSQERDLLRSGKRHPLLEGLTCGSPTQGLPRESLTHALCRACRLRCLLSWGLPMPVCEGNPKFASGGRSMQSSPGGGVVRKWSLWAGGTPWSAALSWQQLWARWISQGEWLLPSGGRLPGAGWLGGPVGPDKGRGIQDFISHPEPTSYSFTCQFHARWGQDAQVSYYSSPNLEFLVYGIPRIQESPETMCKILCVSTFSPVLITFLWFSKKS